MAAILENMILLLLTSTFSYSMSFISYKATLHLSFYLKAKLRYIKFEFSAVILAAILKYMQLLLLFLTYLNSTFFISYESTLYLFVYLNAELRYIRFKFSAAILAAILKLFILLILDIAQQFFTNRKSLKLYYYFHCISHLIGVILVSRIGRHNGCHIDRHLEK